MTFSSVAIRASHATCPVLNDTAIFCGFCGSLQVWANVGLDGFFHGQKDAPSGPQDRALSSAGIFTVAAKTVFIASAVWARIGQS
jgi:hypothetical protein